MGWLRLVGSLKLQVSFAKELYKRDDILPKRPIILRSLLLVATPYGYMPRLARIDRALSGMCARDMTCVYILYNKVERLQDMDRWVCIFGRAMRIIPMTWETYTGKQDFNHVFRQFCVSSMLCFVNSVFQQLCVSSMMCFVKYCIQYKMYTAYEIGGGEGVREKDAMSRVCVCVPHSGCLLNFGGKTENMGLKG